MLVWNLQTQYEEFYCNLKNKEGVVDKNIKTKEEEVDYIILMSFDQHMLQPSKDISIITTKIIAVYHTRNCIEEFLNTF